MKEKQQEKTEITVTLERGRTYMKDIRRASYEFGAGAWLCICSPIAAMFFHDLGTVMMLAMIAAAVGIFVSGGFRLEPYGEWKKKGFLLDPEAEVYVRQEKQASGARRMVLLICGCFLCILSILPSILTESIEKTGSFWNQSSTAVLLFLVGAGVFCIIVSCMSAGAYSLLLEQGRTVPILALSYWLAVTAIYLGWSFWSSQWNMTWLIWPAAAGLFAVLFSVYRTIERQKAKADIIDPTSYPHL